MLCSTELNYFRSVVIMMTIFSDNFTCFIKLGPFKKGVKRIYIIYYRPIINTTINSINVNYVDYVKEKLINLKLTKLNLIN